MIVIVETTFIVEIVLEKGEAPACEQILGLTAPTGEATLVAPAFCLAEAGMMLERRQGERKRLVSDLAERAKNERGSKVHAKYARALEELASKLLRINDVEDQRFVTLSQDQIDRAEIIPLTKSITDEAIMWRQTGFMKKLPDAIVYASVLAYLERIPATTPICFVTSDKAFGNPRILTMLRKRGCTFLRSFTDAVGWIQKYRRSSN